MADLAPHCAHAGCITCGDEAIPVEVVRVQEGGLAVCVDAQAVRTTVEIALVEPVAPGERLLVHAGTAIARAPSADATERSYLTSREGAKREAFVL